MSAINLKVIDISHYNVVSDFNKVKQFGIAGVICKATQGRGMIDTTFAQNIFRARAAGLLVGAYHFNTGEPVMAQVQNFLNVAEDSDLLLALDFEDNPSSQMSLPQAKDFLSEVASRTSRKPVLYSGNRAKDLLNGTIDAELGGYRLWLPQYGPVPKPQASWQKQWLWQFSDGNIGPAHWHVPGVSGAVDLNSYDGTDDQLAQEWNT